MVDKGFRLFKSVGQESIWKIPPGTLFVDPLQELQRKLGVLGLGEFPRCGAVEPCCQSAAGSA